MTALLPPTVESKCAGCRHRLIARRVGWMARDGSRPALSHQPPPLLVGLLDHLRPYPAVVVVSDAERVRWFRRGSDVPQSLWPHAPGRKTLAYDIARGRADRGTDNVYVDEWLSGAVERHRIHEDSRRLTDDLVLSILWWTDESPLKEIVERDEQYAYRRSDWRKDD
jgi:hypothetical protein